MNKVNNKTREVINNSNLLFVCTRLDYERRRQQWTKYFNNVKNLRNRIFPMNTVDQNNKKKKQYEYIYICTKIFPLQTYSKLSVIRA